jgi:hypothetical protein
LQLTALGKDRFLTPLYTPLRTRNLPCASFIAPYNPPTLTERFYDFYESYTPSKHIENLKNDCAKQNPIPYPSTNPTILQKGPQSNRLDLRQPKPRNLQFSHSLRPLRIPSKYPLNTYSLLKNGYSLKSFPFESLLYIFLYYAYSLNRFPYPYNQLPLSFKS